jgi:hypothetical protein
MQVIDDEYQALVDLHLFGVPGYLATILAAGGTSVTSSNPKIDEALARLASTSAKSPKLLRLVRAEVSKLPPRFGLPGGFVQIPKDRPGSGDDDLPTVLSLSAAPNQYSCGACWVRSHVP